MGSGAGEVGEEGGTGGVGWGSGVIISYHSRACHAYVFLKLLANNMTRDII